MYIQYWNTQVEYFVQSLFRMSYLQSDTITRLPEQVHLPRINVHVFVFVESTCSMMLEEYI